MRRGLAAKIGNVPEKNHVPNRPPAIVLAHPPPNVGMKARLREHQYRRTKGQRSGKQWMTEQ
jgi:hypothetical protein